MQAGGLLRNTVKQSILVAITFKLAFCKYHNLAKIYFGDIIGRKRLGGSIFFHMGTTGTNFGQIYLFVK